MPRPPSLSSALDRPALHLRALRRQSLPRPTFHQLTRRLLAVCLTMVSGCAGAPAPVRGPLRVAVSIPPQAWLVDRLGGARVSTQVLLPPGSSPVTYEPTPRQVLELDDARLYVAVGHPDFPFEQRLLDRLLSHRRDLIQVRMTDGLGALAQPAHGPDPDPIDPHVWVAPRTLAAVAPGVAQALEGLDPDHAGEIRARLEAVELEIARVDRDLRAIFADPPCRRFWVDHPAWDYLARQYGLEQVALESGGKEPSAARLVALTDRARAEGVRVIFAQRGFSDRAARALAAEIGARVEPLDPLAYDWPTNLRSVAAELRAALTCGAGSRPGDSRR